MGRKKIEMKRVDNEKTRRVTFKKRRIGVIKKAMELSMLTGAAVMIKVYNEEDNSFVEYCSANDNYFDMIVKKKAQISDCSKFYTKHYNLIS